MNLHRTTGIPDWEMVAVSERTAIQKLAAQTNGYLTPANIATVIGLMGIGIALYLCSQQHYGLSLLVLVLARACDIADGLLAEYTHTKSPLGETFDASADKIGSAALILGFIAYEVLSWPVALLLAIPQVIITLLVLYGLRNNKRIHPSRAGKFSMFALGLTLFAFLASKTDALNNSRLFDGVTLGVTAVAVALSLWALQDYARQLLKAK
ncbi:MAG: CDP-alcohol phosphatidyltransferase family protein [Patescibacteria group bacterium]|nr:CDP-alcohol phosphatidyltransferase family protein [Patescibacteria group bacterium]